MTPLQQLIVYYQGLLILQYAGLPKFMQFINLVVNSALCDGLFLEFPSAFSLTTAVGNQLTLLGEIVGVPRSVFGINPYAVYFNFTRANGSLTSIGFNRWSTLVDPDNIDRWQVQNTYILTDLQLLQLIYLKIVYNNSNSFSQIKNGLYQYFNGSIDIIAPDISATTGLSVTYFNFTRFVNSPTSVGFNRWSTLVDPDYFERWSQYQLMQLNYIVKQPYYNVVTIAQYLNIMPHSMGVTVNVTQE